MLYQLPTGKVIEISTEQFFEMSDEELEYLIAYNYGDVIENPWHRSILTKQTKDLYEENLDLPLDLVDTSEIEKLKDLDMEQEE